jgi:soluble lytic murein transglycosylase-like protein
MPDGNDGTFASNGILDSFHANGASAQTARQDGLTAGGSDASLKMAKTDQGRIKPLKTRFNAVAAQTGLPPALLAAVASRESRCGNVLASDGTGDAGNAFGIMQVDRRFHTIKGTPDPKSQEHIQQASEILKGFLDTIVAKFPTQPPERQLQAAVAAYNCGPGAVASPDTADARTTGRDYSNDVWERARFYAAGWDTL